MLRIAGPQPCYSKSGPWTRNIGLTGPSLGDPDSIRPEDPGFSGLGSRG